MVWYDRRPVLYVMHRADGWHKVGCSVWPERRRQSLSLRAAPVALVKKFPARDVHGVEWLAHYELREVPRRGEWFNAPAEECFKAVRRAIRRHKELGLRGLWALRAREIQRRRRDPAIANRPKRTGVNGRKPKEWPNDEVKAAALKLWRSRAIASDSAAVRAIMEQWSDLVDAKNRPLVTERLIRTLPRSGRNG